MNEGWLGTVWGFVFVLLNSRNDDELGCGEKNIFWRGEGILEGAARA